MRANFQARIYKLSLVQYQQLPSPLIHGWKVDEAGNLEVDWMDLLPAPEGIIELTYCTCKKGKCKSSCNNEKCCIFHGLRCTDLCQCNSCENMNEDDDTSSGDDDDYYNDEDQDMEKT